MGIKERGCGMARVLTDEQKEKMKAGRRASREQYRSWSSGRVSIVEYRDGFRLEIEGRTDAYYARLGHLFSSSKLSDWILLHATDEEREYFKDLRRELKM